MTTPPLIVKLGVLISYYQDPKCLDKCLHSLHNFAFNTPDWFQLCLIMKDGRYKNFESSEFWGSVSSGDTHEMIYDHFASMCNEYNNDKTHRFSFVHNIPAERAGPLREWQKRQSLMDMAARADCDFALVLDSDEYLDNERRHGARMWPEFANELRFIKYQHPTKYHIYGVLFREKGHGSTYYRPRLFFHPEHIRYVHSHNAFNFPYEPKLNLVSPIAIYHRPNECRSFQRRSDSEEYNSRIPWSE